MALRVDYLARETGQNFVRNPLPTIAAVTTVCVALTMVVVAFLARIGISTAFERWNNDVSFIVYLFPDASGDQVGSLTKDMKESPQVDTWSYLDHPKSYEAFKKLFPDDPTIVETVKASDLPTSFRVKPKNPDAKVVEGLADKFRAKPGVYRVEFVAESVRAVQRVGGKIQLFLLAGSIVLAGASVLLIFNTVQTAIFGRRREIEVMKLVGATNWYIRVPFIMEGLLQGLLGSGFACLFAWLFSYLWRGSFAPPKAATLFDNIRWTSGQFQSTVIVVSIVGTLVSAVVAFISTTWYLRV